MPRYVLKIGDRRIAVFDVPDYERVKALRKSDELANRLKDCTSGGAPLWDGLTPLEFLRASPEQEQKWQTVHRRRNAEFGIDEDQGLAVWLVPMDSGHDSIEFKNDWGLW